MSRILTGVFDENPGWEQLLQQEGAPWCRREEEELFQSAPVIVAGDQTSPDDSHRLRQLLREGRMLLCTAAAAELIAGTAAKRRLLKSLRPGNDPLFGGIGLTDLYLQGRIYPGSALLPDEKGVPTVYHGELGGGYAVVLPFDPASAVVDRRTLTKSFYSPSPRLPYERVPLVSRQEVRTIVSRALTHLYHRLGLPYIHRWYYPDASPSVAALRIDTDFASEAELRTLQELGAATGTYFSWFIDVESQAGHLGFYRSLAGHETGLHCYSHRIYRTPADAEADLGKALGALSDAQVRTEGVALPYGQWSPELGKVLDRLDFRYSSEFAYDADNLPSWPDLGYYRSTLLQVPVHPISIGNLRRQGYGTEAMAEYFRRIVRTKIGRREPALLYHHPRNGGTDILRSVITQFGEAGVPVVKLSAYAAWWADRCAERPVIDAGADRIRIDGLTGRSPAMFRIAAADGREAFTAPAPTIATASLAWTPPPVPVPLPEDILRIRRYNPWVALQRAEDLLAALFRDKPKKSPKTI